MSSPLNTNKMVNKQYLSFFQKAFDSVLNLYTILNLWFLLSSSCAAGLLWGISSTLTLKRAEIAINISEFHINTCQHLKITAQVIKSQCVLALEVTSRLIGMGHFRPPVLGPYVDHPRPLGARFSREFYPSAADTVDIF